MCVCVNPGSSVMRGERVELLERLCQAMPALVPGAAAPHREGAQQQRRGLPAPRGAGRLHGVPDPPGATLRSDARYTHLTRTRATLRPDARYTPHAGSHRDTAVSLISKLTGNKHGHRQVTKLGTAGYCS